MALIKLGGGIVGIAGKMAGNVFARNRYGQYVRAWAKPVNPNSDLQVAARGRLGGMGDIWDQTLTEAQRYGWREYASGVPMLNRLGEVMHLTGFNHFVRTNSIRLQSDMDILLAAPTVYQLADTDPTASAEAAEAGSPNLTFGFDTDQPWVDEDDARLTVHVSRPVNVNTQFPPGHFRYGGAVAGDGVTPPTSPATIDLGYPLQAGTKRFWKARILRADGRLSNFFAGSFTIS